MKRSEPYQMVEETMTPAEYAKAIKGTPEVDRKQSDSPETKVVTDSIAQALLKIQKNLHGVKRDANNPFFKSKYATLQNTWEAIKDALQDAEIAISQTIHRDAGVYLRTRLLHVSGAYIDSECPLLMKEETMQALGSAVTYARRYSLAAIVGLVIDEDDDGNEASQPPQTQNQAPKPQKIHPDPSHGTISEAQAARFHAIWKQSGLSTQYRDFLLKKYGVSDSRKIQRSDYEKIINDLEEKKAQLPKIDPTEDIPF